MQTTITNAIAVFLAITVQTASAASIDLEQAYNDLLASDPESCILGVSENGCPIPADGVVIDGFITLSSPDSAAFLEDIAQGTFLVLSSTSDEKVTADFTFDETQVQVSNIVFDARPEDTLTCLVYEDSGSPEENCSSDTRPIVITGYDSIAQLNLSSFEAYTYSFAYNVPIPATFLLFLSGLAGLAGVAGRKRRT